MGKLDAGQRVTGENGFFQTQTIHKLMDVFCERVGIITCFRIVRVPLSAACESQDAERIGKARGKFVEDVSRTPHTGQKDQRGTCSAPIEIVEADSIHINKVACGIR
jgi:hypothetical protein